MKPLRFQRCARLAIAAAILVPAPLLAYGPEISRAIQNDTISVTGSVAVPAAPVDQGDGGWSIQIGAYTLAAVAEEQLLLAAERDKDLLEGAATMIVRVELPDGRHLFRARFGSFTQQEAEELCRQLQQRDETCMSVVQSPASDAVAAGTAPPVQTALMDHVQSLDDASLDEMRGGFFLAGGAQFDFGASVQTLVNGQLALESTVQWTASGATVQQTAGPGTVPISTAQLVGIFGGTANPGMNGVTIQAASGATAVLTNLSGGQLQNVLLNSASNQTAAQFTNVVLTVYNLPQLQQQVSQQLLSMRLANDVAAAGLGAVH